MLKIYKSSAGSGKTFTLVKEYLKLCLPDPNKFKNIVAITFTNAASAEMKDRILKTLAELAAGRATDMANLLKAEGISDRQLANAPIVLEKILHNYGMFKVSTIDSFFNGIVRAFHKELQIPSDVQVYIEADEAIDYAVDQFLYQSRESPDIHKLLVDFVKEKIANSQSWNIRNDLNRMAWELLKDKSFQIAETEPGQITEFVLEMRKIRNEFEDGMDSMAASIIKNLNDIGLEIDDLKNKKGGAISFVLKSLKNKKDYEPGKRFLDGLVENNEWYTATSPLKNLIEEAIETFLRDKCLALYAFYQKDFPIYNTAKEVLKNIYAFGVYAQLEKSVQVYRESKNILLISDMTRILANHVANENISFVYSKIGSRYDHFLIDEFQDTSELQWQSLKPLIENAVSQGASCMIVGDSKQAIYRWRGGAVELIEQQVAEVDFPHITTKYKLDKNYRSLYKIVDFNNIFFSSLSSLFLDELKEYQLLNLIFKDVKQLTGTETDSGYTEVNFVKTETRKKEIFQTQALEILLRQINDSLADGYPLRDITVLIRSKKEAVTVADFLFRQNINFITQDSLNLDHSPTIRLLLCLLCWLNDPENILHKAETIFLYQTYFKNTDGEVLQELKEECLPQGFINSIPKLMFLPVSELVEELVLFFDLNRPDAYLQRFQDAVLEFSIREKGSINSFLLWWQKGKFSVILPEDQDAVKIMTIHKAKGLEFPVVIIPFADWDFSSGPSNIIWVHPEIDPFNYFPSIPINYGSSLKDSVFEEDYLKEEALIVIDNLNLLYVAFTRAKHRLYITTRQEKNNPENGFKNMSQLINKILKPGFDENPSKMVTGIEMPNEGIESKLSDIPYFYMLPEYPVFSRLE